MRASRAVPLLLCLAAVAPLPFSAPAHAETDVEACDRLASNPADPQRPAEAAGVSREDFDAEEALKTCTRALAAQPTEPRLHYQAGRAAYVLEDYATARVEFETAAKAGYKIAAAGMGILYDHGFGLPRDEEKAIDFYKAAADEIGIASHNLAIIYRDSAETPHDYAASMAYFKTAITLGYTDSLHGIGYAYENGFGVPQDWGKAMHWYRRGAAAGIGDSMNNIGWIYQNGFGVTKDAKVALDWYQKAWMPEIRMPSTISAISTRPATACRRIMRRRPSGTRRLSMPEIRSLWPISPSSWRPARAARPMCRRPSICSSKPRCGRRAERRLQSRLRHGGQLGRAFLYGAAGAAGGGGHLQGQAERGCR